MSLMAKISGLCVVLGWLMLLALPRSDAAGLEVPSAPFVDLTVLSGNTIRADFQAGNDLAEDGSMLVTDGGSAIHSYKVEWDTDPGTQEVQTITTSTYIGANEIQTISTILPGQNEKQTISTSSDEVREEQKITIRHATSGSYFFLKLDTTSTGGSVQMSADIPVSDDQDAVADAISVMTNVAPHGRVEVSKAGTLADDELTYTVTFPASMGNVPTMEPFTDKLLPQGEATADVETMEEGNIISGTFRLSFAGYTTSDIPFDATPTEMREALEALPTIETVEVMVSEVNNQRGYIWTVEFTGAMNDGNIDLLKADYTGLEVSNSGVLAGAVVDVAMLVDGRDIRGDFTLSYKGQTGTTPLSYDASAAEVKAELESLSSIDTGSISVTRTGPTGELEYVWTVMFLNTMDREHEGDRPMIGADGTGLLPSGVTTIEVNELRKGTFKTIQEIAVGADGSIPDDTMFTLTYGGEETVPIFLHYDDGAGGRQCQSMATEVQKITSSTLNTETTLSMGDGEVSTALEFRMVYSTAYITETSGWIHANPSSNVGDCSVSATEIASELVKFSVFDQVSVTGTLTGSGISMGCEWTVEFISSIGDVPLLQIEAKNAESNNFGALGYTSTAGDDTIIIEEVTAGAKDAIKAALEELDTIGTVTVTVEGSVGANDDCTWRVTFDTNAGTSLPELEATIFQTDDKDNGGDTSASSTGPGNNEFTNGGVAVGIDVTTFRAGTSDALAGYYALSFRGARSAYLRYDASARAVEQALESLDTIGDVAVFRSKADENSGFTWSITFITELGDNPPITFDGRSLLGTVATGVVAEAKKGVSPPFNSLDQIN